MRPLSDAEWNEIQDRCTFSNDKSRLARAMLELALREFIYSEKDRDFLTRQTKNHSHILIKLNELRLLLDETAADNDANDILLDESIASSPISFVAGGSSQAELLALRDGLRNFSVRVEQYIRHLPPKPRGPDNKSVLRLVLSIDQIVSLFSKRKGLSRTNNYITGKFNDRDLLNRIFKISERYIGRRLQNFSIETAMREATRRRGKVASGPGDQKASKVQLSSYFQKMVRRARSRRSGTR